MGGHGLSPAGHAQSGAKVYSGLVWLGPVSAHTLPVHVGSSASHVPTACLLLPEFWILLLFGEASAELVGGLLLQLWLLPSCLDVRGTVAILSLLLLPRQPFRSPRRYCVRVSIGSLL